MAYIITPAYLLQFSQIATQLGLNSGSLSQQAGVTTINSTTITGLTSTAGFTVGMAVYGPNIQYGSQIVTVNSSSSITINQTASATGTFILSFPVPTTFQLTGSLNSTTTITGLSSTSAISIGSPISGTGIVVGTTVTGILTTTSITISQAATVSATETLSFPYTSFLQTLIAAAQSVMEDYVGFPFMQQQQMEFYDGLGQDVILRRPYVSNVQTVSLDLITGGAYGQFGLTTITGATVTATSTTVTVPSTANLVVGQLVCDSYPPIGNIIPLATYIAAITSSTQFTLTQAALANATQIVVSGAFNQSQNLTVGSGYALVYSGNYNGISPQALLRYCPSYLSSGPGAGGWWAGAGWGFGYGNGSLTTQGQVKQSWPAGAGNIMVVYTGGWVGQDGLGASGASGLTPTVPADLQLACAELVIWMFLYGLPFGGQAILTGESLSKYSYSLGQLTGVAGNAVSSNGALGSIRSILSRYRLWSM